MRPFVLLSVAGALAVAAAAGLVAYFYERPNILRVAVVQGSEDQEVIAAAAEDFAHEHETIRFKVIPVDDLAAAASAMEQGQADLAVVRSDVQTPVNGQTVLIMHKNAAIFIVPSKTNIHSIGDLKGHKLGIVRDPAITGAPNFNLLETALAQYDLPLSALETVSLPVNDIEQALTSKSIDAVFAFGAPGSPRLNSAVAAVAHTGNGKPGFIAIPDAEGIVQRASNYESMEIPRGLFPGSPPLPEESFDTLGASTRLLARRGLADSVVGDLTRIFLADRPRLAMRIPKAARIVAPSTDKSAAIPMHPGAAAYIDDKSESFFEKYSDAFYIGAMILSVMGSALAALASRISQLQRDGGSEAIRRLIAILGEARAAGSAGKLDALSGETDALLSDTLISKRENGPEISALTLAVDQVRQAIGERREALIALPKTSFETQPRAELSLISEK